MRPDPPPQFASFRPAVKSRLPSRKRSGVGGQARALDDRSRRIDRTRTAVHDRLCRPAISGRRRVKDWNIIVTIYQEGFRRALRALQDIGPAEPSAVRTTTCW